MIRKSLDVYKYFLNKQAIGALIYFPSLYLSHYCKYSFAKPIAKAAFIDLTKESFEQILPKEFFSIKKVPMKSGLFLADGVDCLLGYYSTQNSSDLSACMLKTSLKVGAQSICEIAVATAMPTLLPIPSLPFNPHFPQSALCGGLGKVASQITVKKLWYNKSIDYTNLALDTFIYMDARLFERVYQSHNLHVFYVASVAEGVIKSAITYIQDALQEANLIPDETDVCLIGEG